MVTCKSCGITLDDMVMDTCSCECFEKLYCHEPPPFPNFEKIILDQDLSIVTEKLSYVN
jgi:hypothetical protein